jgi:hypothetical protein
LGSANAQQQAYLQQSYAPIAAEEQRKRIAQLVDEDDEEDNTYNL